MPPHAEPTPWHDLVTGPRVGRHRAPGWADGPHTRTIRQHWAAMWDRDTPPTVYSGAALLARRIRKAGR